MGEAIDRASLELPKGYTLMIDLEKDSGTITLLIPQMGDDEGGKSVHEWDAGHFGEQINSAINYAINHNSTYAV